MLNRFRPVIIVSPTKSECRTIVKNYEQAIQQSHQTETSRKISEAKESCSQSQNQGQEAGCGLRFSANASHPAGWLLFFVGSGVDCPTRRQACLGKFEDHFHLTADHGGKPGEEIVHGRTALEVFEQDTDWNG